MSADCNVSHMRTAPILALFLTGLMAAQAPPNHPYRRAYVRQTYGTRALVGVGAHAALGEAINRPKQWGRGPDGLGKRLASGFSMHVLKNTVQFTVAAARHEDLTYHKSTDTAFAPRLRHALVSTVVTTKTTTGQKTPSTGRISGAFTAGLISRFWQPVALRTVAGGFASGGILLAGDAGMNVAREFWPKRKPSLHRKPEK